MKYIWLGIKDYCKDVWHDCWFLFWNGLDSFVSHRLHHTYCWQKNEGCFTKEGNLQHYIQQRKAAKLLKEIKTLQEELKQKGNK